MGIVTLVVPLIPVTGPLLAVDSWEPHSSPLLFCSPLRLEEVARPMVMVFS